MPASNAFGSLAQRETHATAGLIGRIPYRLALAGGWIDQPFVSTLNPSPPGSMVVISLQPDRWFMERAGLATSTRNTAQRLWDGVLPDRPSEELIRELYDAENGERAEPSGSQDMTGLICPGVSRLDYDATYQGGYFPAHVESSRDPEIAAWLERVLHLIPINQRPKDYSPLGVKNLDPHWIERLGGSGRRCFDAILRRDVQMLGKSMNLCMQCWEVILPCTVTHPVIPVDLKTILTSYQSRYPGAMYSGCGGGYLIVASEEDVPSAQRVKVRIAY